MLLPRIILHRHPRAGLVPEGRLKERVAKFCVGEWAALLEASLDAAVAGASAQARRRRGQKDTLERRAARTFGAFEHVKLWKAQPEMTTRGRPSLTRQRGQGCPELR